MTSITINAKTDPGIKRKENQDYYGCFMPKDGYIPKKGILIAVADGMGGHSGGAVASKMAIDVLMSEFYQTEEQRIPEALNIAFQKANMDIFNKSQLDNRLKGMGTTMSAAVFKNDVFFWAHVGDSRGYIIQKKKIRQFTNDHSLVADLIRAGAITKTDALTHPKKNIITKAVGVNPILKVDVSPKYHKLKNNQYVLLCSDGLLKVTSDKEIAQIVNDLRSPEIICDKLIATANSRGAPDNVTVVLAQKNKDDQQNGFIKKIFKSLR